MGLFLAAQTGEHHPPIHGARALLAARARPNSQRTGQALDRLPQPHVSAKTRQRNSNRSRYTAHTPAFLSRLDGDPFRTLVTRRLSTTRRHSAPTPATSSRTLVTRRLSTTRRRCTFSSSARFASAMFRSAAPSSRPIVTGRLSTTRGPTCPTINARDKRLSRLPDTLLQFLAPLSTLPQHKTTLWAFMTARSLRTNSHASAVTTRLARFLFRSSRALFPIRALVTSRPSLWTRASSIERAQTLASAFVPSTHPLHFIPALNPEA